MRFDPETLVTMRKFFYYITTLLFAVTALKGQTDSVYAGKLSLYAFEYASGHQEVYLNDGNGGYEKVMLSTANILGPFKVALSDQNEAYIHERSIDAEGEETYPLIARIKIPATVRNPLVILVPSSKKLPYFSLVLEGNRSNFPEGSYSLVNFSKNDIRALIGEMPVYAPSGKITAFDPSSNSEKLLDVHFQYKGVGKWKTFGRTRWVNDGRKRVLLCAFMNQDMQRMQIRGIPLRRDL
jgi:hypothetical protein